MRMDVDGCTGDGCRWMRARGWMGLGMNADGWTRLPVDAVGVRVHENDTDGCRCVRMYALRVDTSTAIARSPLIPSA